MSDEPNKPPSADDLNNWIKLQNWRLTGRPKLTISYDESDVCVPDINEAEVLEIGRCYGIENLSDGAFSSPSFPANGRVFDLNNCCMIPLVCQRAEEPNLKAVKIWFLCDTGSPFTCLTKKSLEAIFGRGNATHNLYHLSIQDQSSRVECRISEGHFKEVNILGTDAMRELKVSIVVDWKKKEFKLTKQ